MYPHTWFLHVLLIMEPRASCIRRKSSTTWELCSQWWVFFGVDNPEINKHPWLETLTHTGVATCTIFSLFVLMLQFTFFYKIRKLTPIFPRDFICSLFQVCRYYLHVMGFWPLVVETKSITRVLLNLQLINISDSLAEKGNNGSLQCFLSRFISVLLFFCFMFLLLAGHFLLLLSSTPRNP